MPSAMAQAPTNYLSYGVADRLLLQIPWVRGCGIGIARSKTQLGLSFWRVYALDRRDLINPRV